jgi:outer membrane protein insertion porin family
MSRFYWTLFIYGLTLISSLTFSAGLDLSRPIKHIHIENTGTIPPSAPIFNAPYPLGQKWSEAAVNAFVSQIYSSGYFSEVTPLPTLSNDPYTLRIRVVENPTIDRIDITGNRQFSTPFLISKLKTKMGSPLNLTTLNEDRNSLENLYLSQGYDLMRVSEIKMDKTTLIITITEGEIKSLSLVGFSAVSPFVGYREMNLKPGDAFNSKILREDREALLRLGYFSDISYPLIQLSDVQKRQFTITLNVQERKTNLVDVGIEQSQTNAALFIQNSWNHVLINSDHLNTKVRYGADANNVYRITSYTLQYGQPWVFNQYPIAANLDFWEEFHTQFAGIDPSTQILVDNKRRGQQLSLSFPLWARQLTLFTRLKNEDITPLQSLGNTSPYSLRSLNFQLQYRNVSSVSNPKTGDYGAIEYEKGGDFGLFNLGGLDYNRFGLNYARFTPITEDQTFAARGIFGVFNSMQTSFTTFETEAFTMGGANTLRGYKELYPFIGTRRILFNFEYRIDHSDSFQTVLFYDVGRIFNDQSFTSLENWKTGKGIGFRITTPISPLRFDLGWADNNGLMIHFGLGQLF